MNIIVKLIVFPEDCCHVVALFSDVRRYTIVGAVPSLALFRIEEGVKDRIEESHICNGHVTL